MTARLTEADLDACINWHPSEALAELPEPTAPITRDIPAIKTVEQEHPRMWWFYLAAMLVGALGSLWARLS